jgi:hypothetical protein
VWAAYPDASLEIISTGDTGGGLVETFTLGDLDRGILQLRRRMSVIRREEQRTLEAVHWSAESNYELRFSPTSR